MKKILIYCASGVGEKIAYSMDDEVYSVLGFVDSNPETWGQAWGEWKIFPPSDIKTLNYDLIIIAIPEYEKEIRDFLIRNYGVDERKIMGCLPIIDGVHLYDDRVVTLRKCIALLRERGVQGSMAEVGVYRGDFAMLLNRYLPDRKLYLFDTFEGFDASRDKVNDSDMENFRDTTPEYVLSRMSAPEKCEIRKGYFPDTALGLKDIFCLVSLDCDLYKPILAGLEYFYPRLSKGGYIFVHDFGVYHYKGVKEAVYAYCSEHDAAIVPIEDRCLSVVISK